MQEVLEKYNSHTIPYISVEQLKAIQQKDSLLILDAREPEEYRVSHLKNATYIGFKEFSAEVAQQSIPNKNQPIVVYCSLGVRSEKIGEKLKKLGYTNVRNLYGGIFEWTNNNFLVYNSTHKETDTVHAFNKRWSKWLIKAKKVY